MTVDTELVVRLIYNSLCGLSAHPLTISLTLERALPHSLFALADISHIIPHGIPTYAVRGGLMFAQALSASTATLRAPFGEGTCAQSPDWVGGVSSMCEVRTAYGLQYHTCGILAAHTGHTDQASESGRPACCPNKQLNLHGQGFLEPN
jgi:hypothetical protein